MTINTISTLPTAPARTDAPATFVTRADAFLAALVVMQGELNTSIGQMNTDIPLAIAASETAVAAAAAAVSAAGATEWVSGTTYSEGDAVWSPITYQTYRRKTDGAGATDPSADTTNWEKISGVLPTQTGNADKFLTTDGTTASWANLPASAGSADFVATGAIGSGDTVGLRSDGTVEVISGTQVFKLYSGTVTDKAAANFREVKAVYDSVNNKIYAKWNTTTAVYVNVGTVTGSTITWGADQTVTTSKYSNAYGDSGITYDAVADRVIVFYQDGSNLPTFVAGVVTGTTIGFGTPVSLSGVNFQEQQGFSFAYDTEHSTWHFSFENSSNGLPTIVPFTVSGTTITLGSKFDINIYTTNGVSCAYSESQNKIVCGAWSTSTSVHFYVLDYDGSNYTEEDFEFFSPVQSGIQNSYAAWDESTQTFVLIGSKSDNTDVVCAQLVGGQIVIGNYLQGIFNSSYFVAMSIVYSEGKFWIAGIQNGGSYKLYLAEATISSNVISVTLGGFYHDVLTGGYQLNLVADENGIVHTLYGNTGLTEYRHVAFRKASLNTNADSYIGLATAAISDGATGTINILGGTNASQSGLTVGADYWLNLDGTLSTTKTNYAKIGYATAANTIVLSANSNESTAINSGGLYLPAANNFSAGDTVFYNNGVASSLSINPVSSLTVASNTGTTISQSRATPFIFLASPRGGLFVMRNSSNYLVATPMLLEGGSWTAGTSSNIYTGTANSNSASLDGVYNPVSGCFWIVFSDTSYYGRRIGVTVSESGLTVSGSNQQSVTANNQGAWPARVAIDPSTGRMLAAYQDPSTNQARPVAWTNLTGNTISHDDRNNTNAAWIIGSGCDIQYVPEYDKFVVLIYVSNSNQYYSVVNYDGVSDPSYPSQSIISVVPNGYGDGDARMSWCSAHNCFLWFQYSTTSFSPARAIVRAFPFNGTTVTYDTTFDLYTLSNNSNIYTTYGDYNYKTIFTPFDSNLVSINVGSYVNLWSYDGSTMSRIDGDGNASEGYQDYCSDTLSLHFMLTSGTSVTLRTYPLATTNSYAFVGFSSADYSTGDICQVDTASSINNNQTGLTAGSDYYIGANGSLTTSNSGTSAGKALSETEIFVKV